MKDYEETEFERVKRGYISVCLAQSRVLGMLLLIRWMAGIAVYAPIVLSGMRDPVDKAGRSESPRELRRCAFVWILWLRGVYR